MFILDNTCQSGNAKLSLLRHRWYRAVARHQEYFYRRSCTSNIKIAIHKTANCDVWGQLDIQATNVAAVQLSGDAFKLWVKLALNQNGYNASIDDKKNHELINELTDCGYLHSQGDGCMIFDDDCMGVEDWEQQPETWKKIWEEYRISAVHVQQECNYITQKLASLSLSEQTESILLYWQAHFDDLKERRAKKVRNPLRYDFSVLLVWYLWDHFFFKIGDTIDIGECGQKIRYHDSDVQCRIVDAVSKHKQSHVEMVESNLGFWNRCFSNRKIELPLEMIGEILHQRI